MSHILFVTGLESSRPYEKEGGGGGRQKKEKKKAVTYQEIRIFGAKVENPRCFCFASNHNPLSSLLLVWEFVMAQRLLKL